jgi:polyferredoxin
VLFGTIFCGYICPFGSFQEWIGKLGKKLFPENLTGGPEKLDRALRYFGMRSGAGPVSDRVSATLVFQAVDPYYALFNLLSGEVAVTALAALLIIAALSLSSNAPGASISALTERCWAVQQGAHFQTEAKQRNLHQLQKMRPVCPMNIRVSGKEIISEAQCISCHQCTAKPLPGKRHGDPFRGKSKKGGCAP